MVGDPLPGPPPASQGEGAGSGRWLALSLVFVLACFGDLVFLGRSVIGFDHAIEYLPTWQFQRESILRLELPLWDPRAGAGVPLLAAMFGGALDPVRWLFYPLPCVTGYNLHLVFLHVLAAAGAFRLARALGARPAVCAFAAILLGAGGPLRSLGGFEKELSCAAWIPWFLLQTIAFARAPSLERALVAGAIMGLVVLAGGPEYALAAGVLFFCAAHWRMAIEIRSGERRPLVLARLHGFTLVAGVLSALLSLGVLLPALELSRISTRRNGVPLEEALAHATSAIDLLTLAFPNLLGNTAHESWTLGKAIVGPGYSYFLAVLYPGVLAVLLVPFAPYSRSRAARGLLVVLGLALLFSLGKSGGLAWLCFEGCPPLRVFRYPYKAWSFVAPALAVLAAMGLERFLEEGAGKRARMALRGVAALGLVASLIGAWVLVFPESLARIQATLTENPTSRRIDANRLILENAAHVLVVRGLLLAAFALALDQLRDLARDRRELLFFLLCGSAAIDLMLVAQTATPTISKDFFEKPPYLAQFMKAKEGEPPPRFYPSPLSASIPEEFLFDLDEGYWGEHTKDRLRENLATYFGLYQLHNYLPGFLETTNEMYLVIEFTPASERPKILAALGVQFVISDRRLDHPDVESVAESNALPISHRLYRVLRALPRYQVVSTTELGVLDELLNWPGWEKGPLRSEPAYDPVAGPASKDLRAPYRWDSAVAARVVSFAARRVELEVPGGRPDGSFLIARDAFDPRWQASVDGESVTIYNAPTGFRAIPLKPGARRVVMEYDATLARGSFAVQASSWALLAACLLLLRRRGARASASPAPA